MNDKIGFLGLGLLGAPVATNLLKAGYSLRVYNRTASKADPLVALGAEQVHRPADAVRPGGIVVSLLWDDDSVEEVVDSEGFIGGLGTGGIHISMSTISPEASKRQAARHAQHGSTLVEAPIFGRPEAAVAQKLWIPVAGAEGAKARVRPLLEAMGAQGIFDFGAEVGAATAVKLAGNFLIGSAVRSLAEAVSLAEKNGADPKAVVDMLTQTPFFAPIFQGYAKMIVEKAMPPGRSKIVAKDLGLFVETAQTVESPAPIATFYLAMMSKID